MLNFVRSIDKDILSIAVVMVTYNHKSFIAQAIESVMMQKTNFPVHLFIGDDFSSDGSREICQNYKSLHPEKITLIQREKNIGMIYNIKSTFETAFDSGAKYIAVLEGDDYWTDELKLQKQVDFLEANPQCSICITNVKILSENNTYTEFFHKNFHDVPKPESSIDDLLAMNFVPNLTCVFRNQITLPDWFTKVYPGDWQMHLLSAKNGKIGFINEYTSVYRHHASAVYTANSPIDNTRKTIKSLKIVFLHFNMKSKVILLSTIAKFYKELALLYRYKGNYRFYKIYLKVSQSFMFFNKCCKMFYS